MLWVVYGLFHSLMRAAFAETNRIYQVDGWKLAFWQSLFGLLVLLPLVPFMAWPGDERFYIAAVGVSLIFSVGTLIQLTLSNQKKGRVSSIYMPLETLAAFAIWLAVTPAALEMHVYSPMMTAGVGAAFILTALALLKIRPHDFSWQNFGIVIPVALTYAVAGVVTKIVMPGFAVLPMALAYTTVSFAVMTLVMGPVVLFKKKSGLKEPALIRAGFLTGLVSAAGYAAFVASVTAAPNPAYTNMLAMLLPVWLLLWHRARKVEDAARPVPAVLIAGGIVLLVAVAAY